MKINLRIRMKSQKFRLLIFASICAPISAYYGVSGEDITSWSKLAEIVLQAISNPFVVFSIGVGVFNALVDPTTPGLSDSERAMSYNSVKDSMKTQGL